MLVGSVKSSFAGTYPLPGRATTPPPDWDTLLKGANMRRTVWPTLILLSLMAWAYSGTAAQSVTQTLAFEAQCLDLDTGTVAGTPEDPCDAIEFDETPWDLRIAYHADRTVHSVVVLNLGGTLEIAYLEGAVFAEVTGDAIPAASFASEELDVPFDGTAVILIRTDLGAVYKLGNPTEDEAGSTFDFMQL